MRMVILATIMRMQYTGSAGHALQLFVIVTELFQRGPTALHQLIVNHALMPSCQRSVMKKPKKFIRMVGKWSGHTSGK